MSSIFDYANYVLPIVSRIVEELINRDQSLVGFKTFVGAFLALPITLSFLVCALLSVVTVLVMFILKVVFGVGGVLQFAMATVVVLLLPMIPMSRVFISFINRLIYFRAMLRPLSAGGDARVSLVGFKAQGLSKMIASSLPVPAGFVVTGDVFDRWVKKAGIDKSIGGLSNEKDVEDKIREILLKEKLPSGFERKFSRQLRKLGTSRVIIRSSFPGEDSGRSSMAGVYRSVITETSGDQWKSALKDVWASYFSVPARAEQGKHEISVEKFCLPVIVQEYMDYDVALFASSVNFLNGRTEEMLFDIESGPDRRGVVVFNMLTGAADGDEDLVSRHHIERLSDAMLKLEVVYGGHVQIEAGLKGNRWFIHQVRPLTGFKPRDTFVNSYLVDITDEPLTPLSRGLFDLPDSLENLILNKFAPFGLKKSDNRAVCEIHGRFYLHYNLVREYLNPHRLRGPGMATRSMVASWRNVSSAMRIKPFRKEIERATLILSRSQELNVAGARDEILLSLFKTQFELFYTSDFILKTLRGLLSMALPDNDEAAKLVERTAVPSEASPYSEMISELGKLDGNSEEAARAFVKKYGHWGTPEAEVAATRMHDDPSPWLDRAGGAPPENVSPEHGRAAAVRQLEAMLDEAWQGSLLNPAKFIFSFLEKRLGETLLLREKARDILNRFLCEIKMKALDSKYGEDSFYMTPDEFGVGEVDAGAIKARRDARAKAKSMRPGPVAHIPEDAATEGDSAGNKIYGMGVGDGVAEGPVLINPRGYTSDDGEKFVLVVETPDAVYGVMLSGASALVVERGGPLSHLILLAREAGLPVLAGAAGAHGKLRNGDRVRVNGEKGWLEIVL